VLAVLVVHFIAAKKRKRRKHFDSSLQPLAFSLRLLAGDLAGTSHGILVAWWIRRALNAGHGLEMRDSAIKP
jgi:hypothetical protein